MKISSGSLLKLLLYLVLVIAMAVNSAYGAIIVGEPVIDDVTQGDWRGTYGECFYLIPQPVNIHAGEPVGPDYYSAAPGEYANNCFGGDLFSQGSIDWRLYRSGGQSVLAWSNDGEIDDLPLVVKQWNPCLNVFRSGSWSDRYYTYQPIYAETKINFTGSIRLAYYFINGRTGECRTEDAFLYVNNVFVKSAVIGDFADGKYLVFDIDGLEGETEIRLEVILSTTQDQCNGAGVLNNHLSGVYMNCIPGAVCGNSVIEPGEECDDGNAIDGDGCSSSCGNEYCGDGVMQSGLGEQCDDGNMSNGDGCNSNCQNEVCGDGIIHPGEQCDDGNTNSGDGCNATCGNEYCGDGVTQSGLGEQCDDGNMVNGDGCNASCGNEYCGDGVMQPGLGEQCDDGNMSNGDGCNSICANEYCGDGVTQPGLGEQCDDGNMVDGDGCSSVCATEVGQGQGCTPGFWKQSQHFGSWTAPYTPDTPFSSVFEDAFPGKTLLEVLGQGGGGLDALGRHTVAALLDAASADVSYDLSVSAVISMFNAAYPGTDDGYESLKNIFATFNEQGCPLNGGKECGNENDGESNDGKDESNDGKDESNDGKDESNGGKDESNSGKDESNGGKDESNGGKDESNSGNKCDLNNNNKKDSNKNDS
ncbi:MAG: DUF4215 domain-containing protein [Nitrospirae bacterium]|nr:DUF4215 domain-containing protein [Nitrospirota bacterium]